MIFLERTLSLISQKGISKNKMLTDLNLNKNAFIDWSKKNQTPNGETLIKIAQYFNVSTDYLLGLADTPTISSTQENLKQILEEAVKKAAKEAVSEYVQTQKADSETASDEEA